MLLAAMTGAARASAQAMPGMRDSVPTLELVLARRAGGTAWLPDDAVMGHEAASNTWAGTVHGTAFVQYAATGGTRTAHQFGSVNWVEGRLAGPVGRGMLALGMMVSAEPWTLPAPGAPELLQVAVPYHGVLIADRQPPHLALMDVSVAYLAPVGRDLVAGVYLAGVGDPALGPPAYLHRPAALDDPTLPLGHHTQDGTHASEGVVSVDLATSTVHVEGSVFNGAHPIAGDVLPTYAGARLDSWGLRATLNPGARSSLAAWYGYVAGGSGLHVHDAEHRLGASWLYAERMHGAPRWAVSVIASANVPTATGQFLPSALVETIWTLAAETALFSRFEYVRRTAAELALTGSVPGQLDVGAAALGAARRVWARAPWAVWLGARGTIDFVPASLGPFYGSRLPVGVLGYLQVRAGSHEGRESTISARASSVPGGALTTLGSSAMP